MESDAVRNVRAGYEAFNRGDFAKLPVSTLGGEEMSEENVELLRKVLDVYNEKSFAENLHLIDPEVVWNMSHMEMPERPVYRGILGLREFAETWAESWEFDHVEIEKHVDAGDRIVVWIHHTGRGKGSGIDIEQHFAQVWTLRDGRALRMEMYPTFEEALEAGGAG
jgi:ketosteroid isomerase-like protein